MRSEEKESFLEIPLSEIGESYGRLRLIQPQADARMVDSLRQFGQVFPVVVTERYELIDGFKRVRALRRLGVERVKAKVFKLGVPALKAVLMDLNWSRGSISDLEEGLVVQSLCREDGLSQVEVAVLLGRHKSWVCRRLSLVERLGEEALEHIRLGLIPASIGRELARLPRGNQPAALRTILKYRFCSRESAHLISLLLQRPKWDWQNILSFPEPILSERTARPVSAGEGLPPTAALLLKKLRDVKQRFSSIADHYGEEALLEFTPEDWRPILYTLTGIESVFQEFKGRIDSLRQKDALIGVG
jgi:ParB-like chromosome segregation protein Spo0J